MMASFRYAIFIQRKVRKRQVRAHWIIMWVNCWIGVCELLDNLHVNLLLCLLYVHFQEANAHLLTHCMAATFLPVVIQMTHACAADEMVGCCSTRCTGHSHDKLATIPQCCDYFILVLRLSFLYITVVLKSATNTTQSLMSCDSVPCIIYPSAIQLHQTKAFTKPTQLISYDRLALLRWRFGWFWHPLEFWDVNIHQSAAAGICLLLTTRSSNCPQVQLSQLDRLTSNNIQPSTSRQMVSWHC